MIAIAKRPKSKSKNNAWHAGFLAMLPAIRRQARISFRALPQENREEMIQEVIANCMVAYRRLVKRGRQGLAFPSPLARFAIAQVRAGRRIAGKLTDRDVTSRHAQERNGFSVGRLDCFDPVENQWEEIVVEDKRSTPADIAACRIDFANWLKRLPRRQRRIALSLAAGESTSGAARQFGVTAARISQLRLWMNESWERFQGKFDASQARMAAA